MKKNLSLLKREGAAKMRDGSECKVKQKVVMTQREEQGTVRVVGQKPSQEEWSSRPPTVNPTSCLI